MIRATVLYDEAPDDTSYAEHVELCRKVPLATFRHGPVFGSPFGEPRFKYFAEFELPDMDAFKTASRTEEFMATGKHAMELGTPFTVFFAQVD